MPPAANRSQRLGGNLRKNAQVEANGGADSGDVQFVAGAVSPNLQTYCLS